MSTGFVAGDSNNQFSVNVSVMVFAAEPTTVTVAAVGGWPGAAPARHTQALLAGNSTLSLVLPAVNVPLWYPLHYGQPALHNLSVTLLSAAGTVLSTSTMALGFRSVALVTDSGPDHDGSGTSSFAFDINGVVCCNGMVIWVHLWPSAPLTTK